MRFGLKAGDCSGLYYFHEPVPTPRPNDHIFVLAVGVIIFIDPKSMNKITGTTIDKAKNLIDGEFAYDNPNTKSTCGCGVSIEIKQLEYKGEQ